jgi:putative SOS response-associated peptidase YedK
MCGRFAVTTDPALLAERIDAINEVPPDADTGPNYNVAPTDAIVTVVSRHSAPPKPGGSARLDGGEAKLGPSHEPDGTQSGRRARKTPFYIHGDGAMLFAAGLWSVWRGDSQSGPLLSVTIVTTGAVGELAEIHDRMPLLLPENCWDAWLDPDAPADPALLAHPPAAPAVVLREVSTLVNSVRNNGPELIAAVAPQPEQPYLL